MSRQSKSKIHVGIKALSLLAIAMAFFASFPSTVSALGVTPGRTTVDFEPGMDKTFSFSIINNEHKAFNAFIYLEGDLKDYIEIDDHIVEFNESDNSKTFSFRAKLPEKIDTPGDHWAKIVVMELPAGWEAPEGATNIIATVAVIHQLRVKVPYQGKFLQVDLSVQEALPNESVKFFVKLYNLGTDDIEGVQGDIEIFGPTNEMIGSVRTESKTVKSKQKEEFIALWNARVNPGMYHAVATVRYGGEIIKAEKNFYVGNMLIDVVDVSVKDFRLGGVAKFDILAESKWNQPIKGVYAQMIINDDRDNTVADFKSASVDMEPFERSHLYAYWDTEGVMEGTYDAKLALHYGEKTTERTIKTYIGLDKIRTEIVGVSTGAVTGGGDIFQQYPIIILVIILIAINFAWFLYFKKRKK